MSRPLKARRDGRGKEAVIVFLAAFYFLIATNTQSGWLFLLSAFLLGLLAMSWLPPRRAARCAVTSQELLGAPQRQVPLTVRLSLFNSGSQPLREVLLIEPVNSWAGDPAEFRWIVPKLDAGETVATNYTLTPTRRGEHAVLGTRRVLGAPFGLFTVTRDSPQGKSFMVYPRLHTLPTRRNRTRLAGVLTEFASPREKGDSRSLRSLREYRPGDDLRMVHWKSSAKNGGSPLLVREHQAPSRQISILVLDNSARSQEDQEADFEPFETAVSLAASLLWSAHREGTKSTLVYGDEQGWHLCSDWEGQYTALARIKLGAESFSNWIRQAGEALQAHPYLLRGGTHPYLITSADSRDDLVPPSDWPGWPGQSLLVVPPDKGHDLSDYPAILVKSESETLGEALEHV